MIELTYNTPIEITKNQFDIANKTMQGIVAFQEKNNKYFIKLMIPKYKKIVKNLLSNGL